MELPHIGENCSEVTCRQLDFLPFTCPLCKKVFCLQHQKLEAHSCPKACSLDVRVPVCPLCNQAVPAPRGQAPDIAICEHLDNNCEVKKSKIYKNKCCYKNCKKKELMPIQCRDCKLNYCIPHRHPNDHMCTGVTSNGYNREQLSPHSSTNGTFLQGLRDQAALGFWDANESSSLPTVLGLPHYLQGSRLGFLSGTSGTSSSNGSANSTWEERQRAAADASSTSGGRPSRAALSQLQGGMSEDEALALALQQSELQSRFDAPAATTSHTPSNSPEDEDATLQQAIAASLRESTGRRARTKSRSDCSLS